MWSVEQCCNYRLVQLKHGPIFCKLENFPTRLNSVYETYYVMFIGADNVPILFPYAQKRYHCGSVPGDTPLRGLFCPWQELLQSLKHFEKKWHMRGKLILSFKPEPIPVPKQRYGSLAYYLARYPYGYVASVENWAKLRKPDDFPIQSDWLYRTSYLTFQRQYNDKRVFFPYSVRGWALTPYTSGRKNWQMLAEEKCDYLSPKVITQLKRDNWHHNGQFEINFIGVDSLDSEKDIVQFLFDSRHSEL